MYWDTYVLREREREQERDRELKREINALPSVDREKGKQIL